MITIIRYSRVCNSLIFFFSLSAKAHTPHALFSNSSSSHQKSSRRVSTGAVCWYRNSGAVAGSFSPCRCRRAAAVLMCSLQILQFFMRHTRVQDIRRVANLIFNQKGKKYVFLRRLCLVKRPWPEGPSVSFIHIFLSAF